MALYLFWCALGAFGVWVATVTTDSKHAFFLVLAIFLTIAAIAVRSGDRSAPLSTTEIAQYIVEDTQNDEDAKLCTLEKLKETVHYKSMVTRSLIGRTAYDCTQQNEAKEMLAEVEVILQSDKSKKSTLTN